MIGRYQARPYTEIPIMATESSSTFRCGRRVGYDVYYLLMWLLVSEGRRLSLSIWKPYFIYSSRSSWLILMSEWIIRLDETRVLFELTYTGQDEVGALSFASFFAFLLAFSFLRAVLQSQLYPVAQIISNCPMALPLSFKISLMLGSE